MDSIEGRGDVGKIHREFRSSGKREQKASITLTDKEYEHFTQEHPQWTEKTLQLRLMAVTLDTGDTEILCTSLTSYKQFPYDEFKELYHFRWGVEEGFKLFKSRAQIEKFSGKTAKAVKQDFYAKVFTMSLSAILAFPIEDKLRAEHKADAKGHPKKVNRTSALAYMKNLCVDIFIKKKTAPAMEAFDQITYKTTEIIRPGRSNPRIHRPKKSYYMNYKPI